VPLQKDRDSAERVYIVPLPCRAGFRHVASVHARVSDLEVGIYF
jgi:hypothetical protein